MKLGDDVTAVSREGVVTDKGKVTKIFRATGTSTEELDVGGKGQIVQIAGLTNASVTDTVSGVEEGAGKDAPPPTPLHVGAIDPPTVSGRREEKGREEKGREGNRGE